MTTNPYAAPDAHAPSASFRTGDVVVIHDLASAAGRPLNGRLARVCGPLTDGRHKCEIFPLAFADENAKTDALAGSWKRIKPAKLLSLEAAKAAAVDATLPSSSGPASNCRHGGPSPMQQRLQPFLHAMFLILPKLAARHNAMVLAVQAGKGTKSDVSDAELTEMVSFWSAHSSAVADDAWKVALSMAADAVLDSDFHNARQFVRISTFLRHWAELGQEAFLAGLARAGSEKEELSSYRRCLRKTRTDRGCALYVAKRISCKCLEKIQIAQKGDPKTGRCCHCFVELPREKIKKCKACKLVEYCSRECQVKDWKNGHKKDCKILRQQHHQTKQ